MHGTTGDTPSLRGLLWTGAGVAAAVIYPVVLLSVPWPWSLAAAVGLHVLAVVYFRCCLAFQTDHILEAAIPFVLLLVLIATVVPLAARVWQGVLWHRQEQQRHDDNGEMETAVSPSARGLAAKSR